jgi:hypothetical protein
MSLINNKSEGDRIEKLKNKVIYYNSLLNKNIQSGSGSRNEESARIPVIVGSIYGLCSVTGVDAPLPESAPAPAPGPSDSGLVTEGLLIHFDANDPASYTGTGITWVNIGTGGTDYNATLAGGDEENIALPVFVDEVIKSFQFTLGYLSGGSDYLNNNYMYFPRPELISDDFTWCAWIKTEEVGYGSNHYNLMFIVSTETGGVNDDFGFGINEYGKLSYGDGSIGGTDITIESDQEVNTGTWTFVAVTREKSTGTVVLYINGYEDTTGTCNVGNTLSTATYVLIGSETDFPGYTFGGNIGAVLGNTSVLTSAQILQNFNAQRDIYGV